MAGEAAARGVTVQLGSDFVRNAPAAMNDLADDIVKLFPFTVRMGIFTVDLIAGDVHPYIDFDVPFPAPVRPVILLQLSGAFVSVPYNIRLNVSSEGGGVDAAGFTADIGSDAAIADVDFCYLALAGV